MKFALSSVAALALFSAAAEAAPAERRVYVSRLDTQQKPFARLHRSDVIGAAIAGAAVAGATAYATDFRGFRKEVNRGFPETRNYARAQYNKLSRKTSELKEKTENKGNELLDAGKQKLARGKETVKDAAEDVKEKKDEVVAEGANTVKNAARDVEQESAQVEAEHQ